MLSPGLQEKTSIATGNVLSSDTGQSALSGHNSSTHISKVLKHLCPAGDLSVAPPTGH